MIEPMLAKTVPNPEIYESNPCYGAQLKYDGKGVFAWIITNNRFNPNRQRVPMIRIARGEVKTDVTNFYPEICNELKQLSCEFCQLQAELTYYDKKTGCEVPITAVNPTPEFLATVNAVLEVHDILEIDGIDLTHEPYIDRVETYTSLITAGNFEHIHAVELFTGIEDKRLLWHVQVEVNGREGIIYKKLDAPYTSGKTPACIKKKKHDTFDCVVIGVTRGNGKYKDLFGALILAQYQYIDKEEKETELTYVGKCSGMDDETRSRLFDSLRFNRIAENSVTYCGKVLNVNPYCHTKSELSSKSVLFWNPPNVVCEVKAMRRNSNGHLYLPRFVRVRDDKPAAECTF